MTVSAERQLECRRTLQQSRSGPNFLLVERRPIRDEAHTSQKKNVKSFATDSRIDDPCGL